MCVVPGGPLLCSSVFGKPRMRSAIPHLPSPLSPGPLASTGLCRQCWTNVITFHAHAGLGFHGAYMKPFKDCPQSHDSDFCIPPASGRGQDGSLLFWQAFLSPRMKSWRSFSPWAGRRRFCFFTHQGPQQFPSPSLRLLDVGQSGKKGRVTGGGPVGSWPLCLSIAFSVWCCWSSFIPFMGPSSQPQAHGQVPVSILLLTHPFILLYLMSSLPSCPARSGSLTLPVSILDTGRYRAVFKELGLESFLCPLRGGRTVQASPTPFHALQVLLRSQVTRL